MDETFEVKDIDFHPVLKDVENIFWLFLLSMRALSDVDVQSLLRTKNSLNKGYGGFNDMLDKFNKSTNLNIEINGNNATSKLNILNEMNFTGKAMAILTYDYLTLSSYNSNINQDNKFQFLRHVRNGAAHHNTFNLKDEKGEWKIDENQVIEWNGKKISRELQGKQVFGDFISVFEIFVLTKHFSDQLTQIDNKAS